MGAVLVVDYEAARFPANVRFKSKMKRHPQDKRDGRLRNGKCHARVESINIYMGADKVHTIRVVTIGQQKTKCPLSRMQFKMQELREVLRHDIC